MIGLQSSIRSRNAWFAFLMVSLFTFIVFGLPKVNWGTLSLATKNIMPNGPKNFFTGVALLSFACSGAKFVAENGDDIIEPSRDHAKVIILSASIIAVFCN